MQTKLLFLGACAFAAAAGAVGGAAIDTTPITRAGLGGGIVPRDSTALAQRDDAAAHMVLPEHYAMTTPEGRIKVAELANRGLYAQRRFGWNAAAYQAPPEQTFLDETPIPTQPEDATLAPPPPVEPVAVPAGAAGEVTPRIINVAAELTS